MVLRAFWNKYRMGCDEHLLVHRLREDAAYLPGLSRVAVDGDQIVGAIFYAQATLRREQEEKKALLFGPLCVAPEWQGCGVGTRLLRETIGLSRKAGYVGIIICGEPDYYPRHGFVTCDRFGITTADGKNFDAFMGLELAEGGLHLPGARFYEPEVYENLSEQENERFTEQFDAPRKQYFPGQWK
ncbi:MAG: N-acetyltransferase [Roseburia sp.]|nr:N-acetyltransferase [Roseburia sp.]